MDEDTITAASTKVLFGGFQQATASNDVVLERFHGVIQLVSDQAAGTENQQCAFGAILVSNDAFGVGITAIPGPLSDAESDWAVHQMMVNRYIVSTAVGFDSVAGRLFAIDGKARRRVPAGYTLAMVYETGAISDGCFLTAGFRALFRLRGT